MRPSIQASQTYNELANLPIKKVSLEKAEAALLSHYETEIKRRSSKQLQLMNKDKVGKPYIYSRIFIEYAAIILYLRTLSYRRQEEELFLRAKIRISKSQLQERITKLLIDINIEVDCTPKSGQLERLHLIVEKGCNNEAETEIHQGIQIGSIAGIAS